MRADGLCGTITCDAEYPPRVAFSLLTKILEDFEAQNPGWRKEQNNEVIVLFVLPANNNVEAF